MYLWLPGPAGPAAWTALGQAPLCKGSPGSTLKDQSGKHVKPTAGRLHATRPTSREFDILGDLIFFFWHLNVPQMKIRNSLIQEAL